jgi:hypothetical protein
VALVGKLRFKVGIHSGVWDASDEPCVSVRDYDRCGRRTSKTVHQWSEFEFLQAQRCEQQWSCTGCVLTDSRTQHPWSTWEYNSATDCRQIRSCRRCDTHEESLASHADVVWEYERPSACRQRERCLRCTADTALADRARVGHGEQWAGRPHIALHPMRGRTD